MVDERGIRILPFVHHYTCSSRIFSAETLERPASSRDRYFTGDSTTACAVTSLSPDYSMHLDLILRTRAEGVEPSVREWIPRAPTQAPFPWWVYYNQWLNLCKHKQKIGHCQTPSLRFWVCLCCFFVKCGDKRGVLANNSDNPCPH